MFLVFAQGIVPSHIDERELAFPRACSWLYIDAEGVLSSETDMARIGEDALLRDKIASSISLSGLCRGARRKVTRNVDK